MWPPRMPKLAVHYGLIITIASVVLFTGLGSARLWDRDEPRNAGCAAEMMARGDWIVPIFNGELRAHKPVLLYWFIISAYHLFGINEFAARFWSAVLAIGTTLLVYHIGRRLFEPRGGLWAAVILSTALMFDVAGRAATPDSVLIFFCTAAICVYVLSVFAPAAETRDENVAWSERLREPGQWFPSWPASITMYGLMGMAVLAKGPVGLVLPTAVIGMFLLIARLPASATGSSLPTNPRSRTEHALGVVIRIVRIAARPFAPAHFLKTCWLMRPCTALAVAGLVALPWYVAVGLQTHGDFLHGFLLEHNLGRAMRPMEGHNGSILYYPAAVLFGFFPWSVFMLPLLLHGLQQARSRGSTGPAYTFAFCWLGVYLGVFSVAQTKLPSYITPCYPGLALLAGAYIHNWTRRSVAAPRLWSRAALGSLAAVGIVICIALPIAAHRYLPGEEWLGVLGLVPLAGAAVSLYFSERDDARKAAFSFAAMAVLLSTGLFGWMTGYIDRHQQSDRILSAIRQLPQPSEIGSYGCLEPSWVFYARQPIMELRQAPRDFLAAGSHRCLITTDERWQELQPELPAGVMRLAEVPYFLKDEQLVLLGWPAASRETAAALGATTRR